MSGRRSVLLLWALAVVALASAGCSFAHQQSVHRIGGAPYTKGSGNVATVTRSLEAFHAVSAETGLTVYVKHGGASSAKVTADDNLTSMIKTDVTDGALRIWVDGNLETGNELRIDVAAAGTVNAIAAKTGSTLDMEDVAGDDLSAVVDAGATVRAGGQTGHLSVSASSGSTADLRNVKATLADVNVDGGSTAFVRVSGSVTGECTGGSTLHVLGGPGGRSVQNDTSSTVKFE